MNTNWSSPKTNIIAALRSLRKALKSGFRARLRRLRNADCNYPILRKKVDTDFRNYEFSIGYASSIASIMADPNMSCFQKELSLNYVTRYGTPEAKEHYYNTRELSADNDQGIGSSHLVHVEDYLEYLKDTNQYDRERLYRRQYYPAYGDQTTHFFDFYRYKYGSAYAPKKFWRKLWVVELIT